MKDMLRVGIVGLGRLGRQHAQCLRYRIPGVHLLAAASPLEKERAWVRDELGVERVVEGLDELLAIDGLDAVVLVTPTALHAAQSIQVLEAGKHLFVEKPLALDVASCEQVGATHARTREQHPGQIAMVGFVRRFDASYRHARAAIVAGEIGTPFYVRSQTCDKLDPEGFFIQFSASSGGLIMDCNIHDIDLARWLLSDSQGQAPRARRVHASGGCFVHPELAQYQDVDNAVGTIEFEDGRLASIYASRTFAHGHETSTEVIASAGKLLIGAGAALDRVVRSDARGVGHAALPDFFERFREAFDHELQHFVDACLGRVPLALSLDDAIEATRIGAALTTALRTGKPQAL